MNAAERIIEHLNDEVLPNVNPNEPWLIKEDKEFIKAVIEEELAAKVSNIKSLTRTIASKRRKEEFGK